MKVYFSGSLYPQGEFQPRYEKIVEELKNLGYDVLEDTTISKYLDFLKKTEEEIKDNYNHVVRWIESCDFAVFEASYPSSLSIGHEISLVLSKGKPVIVMYLEDKSPRFLLGNKNDMIIWGKYHDSNIDEIVEKSLESVKNKVNVRFNFFVPKELAAQLDHMALNERVNKSEYIRQLIEKDMKRNKRY